MKFEYVRDMWVCVTFDMSKQSMLACCAQLALLEHVCLFRFLETLDWG